MRFLRFLILLLCVTALVAPDAADAARGKARRAAPRWGLSDPRYAALVINPKTGEIYHQQNADARRYPASLTKMMTLYLLFEALEQHKVSMSTRLRVSDYASVQPQTNISLTTRDTVPVETAIKALVVRSANDVAVVVAENLGGSVPAFAKKMTAKAHQLGMNNTVFQNPNGLPNSNQYTTAKDMAKIGIALKRDFPQYYRYFSVRSFSWNGVTYYTHNRVMLRYAGTDGIKTGFINASGFNVVTSTERGGRPLVGVVMGGTSAQWRDDRMIQLLDAGYATLAKRGQAKGAYFAQNLPNQKNGQPSNAPAPAVTPRIVTEVQVANVPADRGVIRESAGQTLVVTPQPVEVPVATAPQAVVVTVPGTTVSTASAPVTAPVTAPIAAAQPIAQAPVVITPPVIVPPPAAAPAPNTLDAQMAALQQQQQTRADAGVANMWGIQVGAFSSRVLAEQAALQAYQLAQRNLQGSRISVIGTGAANAQIHRARLENITENQAKKACETLISNNSPCFIYRSGAQNL